MSLEKNVSNSMKFIKALRDDLNTKALYAAILKKVKPSLGELSIEKYWKDALTETFNSLSRLNGNYCLDEQSLKRTILQSAEFGLCFNSKFKECYIEITESMFDKGILEFDLGLKYNGLKSRLVRTCGVKAIATEVVHVNDTFEWRGQWNEPYFVMSNSKSDIHCCYGVVQLKGNRYMAYKLNLEEMLALEEADIQRAIRLYGDKQSSFYCTPYRKRMFEIATLRYIYRELVSLCDEIAVDEIVIDKDLDEYHLRLAKAMELELTKQLVIA
jgi:hypothetical protein